MLNNKNIFIAGATGMAGTAIMTRIVNDFPAAKITGTFLNTKPFYKHERIKYLQADLTNRANCRRVMEGCDIAVLVAANSGGAGSFVIEPSWQVSDNLIMDTLLLESLVATDIKKAVFVSSATVYQEFEGFIVEDSLDWNQNPYASHFGVGWEKRSAEKLCEFWHKTSGLNIIIARAANIYGPFAKFDPQRSNFIPALIRKAVDKQEPFEVWGSPDVCRDVIYSDDFSRAIIALLTQTESDFDVVNLGSGISVSVGEVVAHILEESGYNPKQISFLNDKPVTIPFRGVDCGKIKQKYEWSSEVKIQQGIKQTVDWWIKNKQWWNK